jgi:hypothetical protein
MRDGEGIEKQRGIMVTRSGGGKEKLSRDKTKRSLEKTQGLLVSESICS